MEQPEVCDCSSGKCGCETISKKCECSSTCPCKSLPKQRNY